MTKTILLLHLLAAFAFVGGSVVATLLRVAAMRRSRPSEIALLLRSVKPAVPLVGGGLVATVVFGAWLVERVGYDWGATWLSGTLALVVWMIIVGAIAGRADRHTRELAERLAGTRDTPDDGLRRRLFNPVNLALNASMLAAAVAIIALMVIKPA